MKIIICLAILALLLNNSVAQAKNYRWQLAQSWEKDSLLSESVNRFVELTNTLSSGRLQISVSTQEEHKQPLKIFKMVQDGKFQIGHSESSYWREIDSNTLFFSSVPFGMTTPELYSWFYQGGGMELMEKVYKKHDLLSFPGGNTGSQMAGWFRREICCLTGLRGLTVRMSGLAGEVMRNIGVDVVDMPSNQFFDSLKLGTIDAIGYVGPAIDFDLGFYKAAPFYYTGWNAPSSEMQFLINRKAFNSLPKDLQAIVKKAMRLAAYDTYIKITYENGRRINQIIDEYPEVKIRAFPPIVIKALNKETERLIAEIASQGDSLTREIIDSMQKHKNIARAWTRVGDQAYLNSSGI